jgi:hypothetical protein
MGRQEIWAMFSVAWLTLLSWTATCLTHREFQIVPVTSEFKLAVFVITLCQKRFHRTRKYR